VKPNPTQEPQPVIHDPILNITFPYNLTNPETIPTIDPDPVLFPIPLANLTNATAEALVNAASAEIRRIISANNSGLASSCAKCIAALGVGQLVAQMAPAHLPDAMVSLCQATGFASNASCLTTYRASSFGATWTQILAKADVSGIDGQWICTRLSASFCAAPNVTSYKSVVFPKPKPAKPFVAARSGKRVKVLHLSDFHLGKRLNKMPGWCR